MQERVISPGRPKGSLTADPEVAQAFGSAVRAIRTAQGLSQEALAHRAKVERSHMGKIERGAHMPTLAVILRLAKALDVSSAELMLATEERLPATYLAEPGKQTAP